MPERAGIQERLPQHADLRPCARKELGRPGRRRTPAIDVRVKVFAQHPEVAANTAEPVAIITKSAGPLRLEATAMTAQHGRVLPPPSPLPWGEARPTTASTPVRPHGSSPDSIQKYTYPASRGRPK